jgi:cytochrome P450
MALEALLVTVFAVLSVCVVIALWMIRPKPVLPGAVLASKHHWLLGHGISITTSSARYDLIHELTVEKDYKPIQINLPALDPVINLSDQADLMFVLKSGFNNFVKGTRFNFGFHELLGEGIFNADGENWRAQRKLASLVFTSRTLREIMFPVFLEHSQKVEEVFMEHAETMKPIDVQDMFAKYTMDSFFKIAFGITTDTIMEKSKDGKAAAFTRAFDNSMKVVMRRFISSPVLIKLQKFLNVGPEAELPQYLRVINEYVYELLDSRMREFEEAKSIPGIDAQHRDLLGLFLEQSQKSGIAVSKKYLRDVILNFIIAGRDTTACALTWTFCELIKNRNEEAKLVSEIQQMDFLKQALPNDEEWMDKLYQATTQNQALSNVFWETLRLHPSVPMDSKVAVAPVKLPSGVECKPGTIVNWTPYSLGRSEKIWGEDAVQFRPDRWNDDAMISDDSNFQYLFPVFNAGYRTCLGKNMALIEGKLLILWILRNLSFEMVPGQKTSYHPNSITLWMEHPFMLTFKKRTFQ